MSTKLTEYEDYWTVETVATPGKARKIPRGAVQVPKGDESALIAEMVRQADAARKWLRVDLPAKGAID